MMVIFKGLKQSGLYCKGKLRVKNKIIFSCANCIFSCADGQMWKIF